MTHLRCLEAPRAWVSRWGYLVTPHIDKLTGMDCSYLCDILHYLLKERFGTPLVKLSVDLVDVDNKAALDLLCALFKHFNSADGVEVFNGYSIEGVQDDIKKLCKSLLNLLEAAVWTSNRTGLVEKCCIFYNELLNIKFAGITEEVLCTSKNVKLMKIVFERYKSSDVVQEKAMDICVKCICSLESDLKEITDETNRKQQELQTGWRELNEMKYQKQLQQLELQRVQRDLLVIECQYNDCKRKLDKAEQDLARKKRRLDLLKKDDSIGGHSLHDQ